MLAPIPYLIASWSRAHHVRSTDYHTRGHGGDRFLLRLICVRCSWTHIYYLHARHHCL